MAVLLLLVVCCVQFSLGAENDSQKKPGIFQFDRYMLDRVPGGYFYPFFIENYAPDATFLTEENNGFSMIDNPRVYFEGDSFLHFNWNYNGMSINSALEDGTPAVMLPFSSISSLQLQGTSPLSIYNGMNFQADMPEENYTRLNGSVVLPDVGGYWATFMIKPSHPKDRADRLYTERRKIHENYYLDYAMNRRTGQSSFQLGASYFGIKRQFNDFNVYNQTFIEDGKLFMANAQYRRNLNKGFYEVFGVMNYLDRSNLGAETGSFPQETTGKKRFSLLTGFMIKRDKLSATLSVLYEKDDLTPFVENYSKDLMDNDGDGFFPYGSSGETKTGKFSSPTIGLNLDYALIEPENMNGIKLNTFGKLTYSSIKGDETVNNFNSIYYDKNPYQVVLWNGGGSYTNTNFEAKAGVNASIDISKNIALVGNAFIDYNGVRFKGTGSRNNLSFTSPGIDVGILLFKNKKTNILFSCGILPYDIRENVNFFLEPNRPSGVICKWIDRNGDSQYQVGEAGAVFGYTGGAYHYAGKELKSPYNQQVSLRFTTPISKYFVLNVNGLYKKMKRMFRVKFDQEYGSYETVDGTALYFFNRPFQDYYLVNGGYEKDPFYAQFSFEINGKRPGKWFYSFSFMAHMGMGDTAFGNGPASNDIGILDESQANPNSWINGYGRVDGDRGFVAKSYFGYYLAKNLFAAVSLKYRDGNPFAFFNTVYKNNQRIIYYKTIKAENEKGIKGGPREDYIGDLSLNFSYNFKLSSGEAVLSLSVFNILDIGAELSEYVFSGGARDAYELQLPRSIRLTFGWRF